MRNVTVEDAGKYKVTARFYQKKIQFRKNEILKRLYFVAHVLNFNIFVAGTTLENQMQQSVSTLTVSRNLKKCGRRNLS